VVCQKLHVRTHTCLAWLKQTFLLALHTISIAPSGSELLATVAWQHLGQQHFLDTCFCCSVRFLQANSAQEVPLLEPISHAVLQQDLSTQQPSAALFSDGVTSRHAQVPSNPNKLQHEVRAMYIQRPECSLQFEFKTTLVS
jgi:hypothetical protein